MSNSFANRIISLSPVPVGRIECGIDRIQVVIRNTPEAHTYLKGFLDLKFDYLRTTRDKKKGHFIRHYLFNGSKVQLVWGKKGNCYLILFQPSTHLQMIIKKGIEPIMGLNVDSDVHINLQQVEFSYDVYPLFEEDSLELGWWLEMTTVLKYSRKDSFNRIKNTAYQGLKGNIRRGSCGLRLYQKIKDEEHFARLEIQLNTRSIKREKLDLESLPIRPDLIHPSNYIQFREPINSKRFESLLKTILRKRYPYGQKGSEMRKWAQVVGLRNLLLEEVLCDEVFHVDNISESFVPVAKQINGFKVVKEKYKLPTKVDTVFPKSS